MLLRLCDQESNNNEIGNIQFDDSFDEKVQKFMFYELAIGTEMLYRLLKVDWNF